MTVTADDLDAVMTSVVTSLSAAVEQDWTVPAGPLEWDCWHTSEHLGDTLFSYAGQVLAQPRDRYAAFLVKGEDGATAEQMLEFVDTAGRILALTVRAASPATRAYHPSGMADPEGFAAMGCVEILAHGNDIAVGLGLTLDPPRDVCARILARMFPDEVGDLAGVDSWLATLWATGRASLPGRPRREKWRWRGAPLGED
jgi:hypothetical protein